MSNSNKRKKAAATQKVDVQEQVASLRFIVLATDGINNYIQQRTMSVPEAKNALQEALQALQQLQRQVIAAQQQAAEQVKTVPPVEDAPVEQVAEDAGEPAEVGTPD